MEVDPVTSPVVFVGEVDSAVTDAEDTSANNGFFAPPPPPPPLDLILTTDAEVRSRQNADLLRQLRLSGAHSDLALVGDGGFLAEAHQAVLAARSRRAAHLLRSLRFGGGHGGGGCCRCGGCGVFSAAALASSLSITLAGASPRALSALSDLLYSGSTALPVSAEVSAEVASFCAALGMPTPEAVPLTCGEYTIGIEVPEETAAPEKSAEEPVNDETGEEKRSSFAPRSRLSQVLGDLGNNMEEQQLLCEEQYDMHNENGGNNSVPPSPPPPEPPAHSEATNTSGSVPRTGCRPSSFGCFKCEWKSRLGSSAAKGFREHLAVKHYREELVNKYLTRENGSGGDDGVLRCRLCGFSGSNPVRHVGTVHGKVMELADDREREAMERGWGRKEEKDRVAKRLFDEDEEEEEGEDEAKRQKTVDENGDKAGEENEMLEQEQQETFFQSDANNNNNHHDEDDSPVTLRRLPRPPTPHPHACPLCRRGFSRRSLLRAHMVRHYEQEIAEGAGLPQDSTQCPFCLYDASSRSKVLTHLGLTHGMLKLHLTPEEHTALYKPKGAAATD